MRCRWRGFLWVLLMAVIILNAAIFYTMPESKENVAKEDAGALSGAAHKAASHLQVLRKRLNANFNSSSLHRVESSLVGAKPHHAINGWESAHNDAAEDEGNNKRHPHEVEEEEVAKIEEENEEEEEGDEEMEDEQDEQWSSSKTSEQPKAAPNQKAQQRAPTGHGTKANYSIPEVDNFVALYNKKYAGTAYALGDKDSQYVDLLFRLLKLRNKGMRLPAYAKSKGRRPWERYHQGIRQNELYDPFSDYVAKLVNDLLTQPIVDVEQKDGGTQIKLMITFANEGQALFKPMRFSRKQETLPDHFYFADYERHNAEIAAFHLDKILGFNRVPPTVGRLFNISSDLQKYADGKLAKTFFISPAGNLCFHGQCSYYCDSSHPICGNPVMLEGSLAALLPPLALAKRKTWRNPWKRSYSKHRKAYWEVYSDLCLKVQAKPPYSEGRRLLDILDIAVYDFLTGNLDRHHYETFQNFGNETFLLHLDQGRAFGKAKYDCISCLAPVRQCCMIRLSTLTKLVKLYQGPNSLSELMRKSMAGETISPILAEPHLDALDRRVSKILNVIHGCMGNGRNWDDVVIDDGVS